MKKDVNIKRNINFKSLIIGSLKVFLLAPIFCSIFFLNCNHLSSSAKLSLCFDSASIKKKKEISFSDIGNIDTYKNQYIQIDGYFHFGFEDVALYPSRNSSSSEALWIDFDSAFPNNLSKELESLNRKQVSVLGVLDKADRYSNYYRASLVRVICIKEK
ncbi:MAG TPA: hypothetical protein VG738_19125 [Chitinophagaceae bacterium]|nr:hypothetical protein [Chitinophagaceae bacterium]